MMDLKELDYQLEHNNGKLKRQEEDIAAKKAIQDSLNIENKMKKLEKSLSSFTGNSVTIKL